MKFLIDAQLPPALATWIENRDHQASHIVDVGGLSVSDGMIWVMAPASERIALAKAIPQAEVAKA